MKDSVEVEFDEVRRILYLSISEPIQIRAPEQLDGLCEMVEDLLSQHGPERVYMIVDISNLGIDPFLNKAYGRSIRKIAERFLYPGGIARFGYQITRVTVELGLSADEHQLASLFPSRTAAEHYIDSLIAKRSGEYAAIAAQPGSNCNCSIE